MATLTAEPNLNTTLKDKRILVIDDDRQMLELLAFVFGQAQARVYTATTGEVGLRQFFTYRPDLVVVDIMMPQLNGWDVCHQIRRLSDIPIIMLTALHEEKYVIRGLECGADDYMAKPFGAKVLVARSAAVLRRKRSGASNRSPKLYSDGRLTIDFEMRQVFVEGERVALTAKEYKLLNYLFQNANQVVTHEQILDYVWGWNHEGSTDYVHVYISRLRQKLKEDPRQPRYLITEHGLGYQFEKLPAVVN